MKRKKPLPKLEKVEIIDAGSEGKAIARHDGMVIFIPFVVPGDIVDIQVTRKKKNFFEGKALNFHQYSSKRTEPRCQHFGVCGGCKWQNMLYEDQLLYKQKQVKDNFDRIGKFPYPEMKPILGSEELFFYRNKLEYSFSSKKWLNKLEDGTFDQEPGPALGFHVPVIYDKVVDIQECFLQEDLSNKIRNTIRDYALEHELTFYDARHWDGLLRNLIIRNTTSGQWMVIMVFNDEGDEEMIAGLMSFIRDTFPQVISLMYCINPKKNDDISDLEVELFNGVPFITEEMPSYHDQNQKLKFNIGPKSFFQTNTKQAERLYRTAVDFAEPKKEDIVFDLYTGTGTIANYIAGSVKKVVGIDNIEPAIENARENAMMNGIKNTDFIAGDLARVFTDEFLEEHGRPDLVIADPPRAGMHPKVVEQILLAKPDRIVYVSCNPATQARDIAMMTEQYSVEKVQPVDMFPHTQHVENVVLMKRKGEE